MNNSAKPKMIALTGGSGAGKTWLANRLCQEFGDEAISLSLDDFYHDLSRLPREERAAVNFDHPDAIDWALFEKILDDLQNGLPAMTPRYDFASHTRMAQWEPCNPRPYIFVEGLWLLRTPRVRDLFELRIFLRCPEPLRWHRRLARDRSERGRSVDAIGEHFWKVVAPMHDRFVKEQELWADVVLEQPLSHADLSRLVVAIRALRPEASRSAGMLAGASGARPPLMALTSS
jgi:uridine kinase